MKLSFNKICALFLLCTISFSSLAQIVRIKTTLGNIDIELSPDSAPNTVANFLSYINNGDYDESVIHRLGVEDINSPVFVVQGGGFNIREDGIQPIPAQDAIANEFSLPNLRGTIAMAKISGQPDSATSQWYINTVDNPFLDEESNSGGFTVFGHVIAGMDVVDLISTIRFWNKGGSFASVPLINYPAGEATIDDYVIKVTSIAEFEQQFKMNAGLNGGWYNPDTSGQGIILEMLPGLDLGFMGWYTYDAQAPATGTTATIGYAGHRWLTGLGSLNRENNSVTFDLVNTSGGIFNDSQAVTNSGAGTYGSMTITFTDCSHATVDFSLTAQELSGSFPIQRISSDNVALCERLSAELN